ncbi:MAG: DUF2621 family protein [Candidatus Omnitrophica bacterium]|nr:DUF2621 family protein [Candidatus Omnitrophota bacterium]
MATIETNSMSWEKTALEKYHKMLQLIPVFHRGIAKEVVNKKAEQLALARGSSRVEEQDIVRSFLTEVPKAFYSLMVRIMDEVGFDYKKYGGC